MTEYGSFQVPERFLIYSKPELLQLASYLAQHDVAFNNLPVYPTEECDGDDGNSVIREEPEPIVKKEKPKNAPAKPSPRSHSPPVRDTGVDVPPRKPLYAPTERQASHLRQLINKSKAALLKLDSEILAERSDLRLNERKDFIEPLKIQRPRKRPIAPAGVLKPKVRGLSDKGTPKTRRPTSGKWVTKTINPSSHQPSRHALDPQSSRDTRILSAYLKQMALEKVSRGQEDLHQTHVNQPPKFENSSADFNALRNYRETSTIHYKHQYPPEFTDFLEKWGSKLDNTDYKEVGRHLVHFASNRQLESSTESASTSTDSISQFIRRHAKHKTPRKSKCRSTGSKSSRSKSPSASKSKKTSVQRNTSKVIRELKENETPYQILRLPIEKYKQLLARSKTEEVANADRYNYENLLSSRKSEKPPGIFEVCNALSEEIVNACLEAGVNLVDNLSNDVINELLRSELAISSSSWSSFSGISESPQRMRPLDIRQLTLPAPSKTRIHQSSTPKKNSTDKSKFQMLNQTVPRTFNLVEGYSTPTNLSVIDNKGQDFVLDGDSVARTHDIRLEPSRSPHQKQIIAGDGSLVKNSFKEGSVVERVSTPEELRLDTSNSDIIRIRSTNGCTLIKNASGVESNSSLASRVSTRQESEPEEVASLKRFSSLRDLASIDNNCKIPTNGLEVQVAANQNSLKSTSFQDVLAPDEFPTLRPVVPHNRPLSLDLLTLFTSSSASDTSISNNNTTQRSISSPNGSSLPSCQFYEDDFESAEGID